jgi:N-acyl-D-amino-acid deacylase
MSNLFPTLWCLSLATFLVLAASAAAQVPDQQPQVSYPATGKKGPGLEPLDSVIVTMMARHGIPGASLALAKDGKLVFARGYGWANLANQELVQPNTLFGVASLSKTITAAAILKLGEEGKLDLDARAFAILDHLKPRPGAKVDRRLYQITVRQLLHHAGGWDHKKSGDPVNWTTQMHLKRKDRTPIAAAELISYTMGVPLDFDPGTAARYSNFGYIVLGEVIAKVAGQSYEQYVREHVFAPLGIRTAALHQLDGRYFPNEARRYLAGTETELPPWQQKYSDAAGGWTMSAVDMARFLCGLDGTARKPLLNEKSFRLMLDPPPPPLPPLADGTHVGLGWDKVSLKDKGFGYFKDGSWYGMRSFMSRRLNGVNAVLLFNASMQPDVNDKRLTDDAVQEVRKILDGIEKYPEFDLFSEIP